MHSRRTHLSGTDLLACAVLGAADLRRRVEHELDRRAGRALVRRILADGRTPPESRADAATAGAPRAA
ncbi:MAG: hypothetical protein R6X20_01535 [Phycisphaerae bacterium]